MIENEATTFETPADEVETLTGDQRAEWLKSGELPSDKPKEEPPKIEQPKAEEKPEAEQSRFQQPPKAEKKPGQMGYRELRDRVADLERQLEERRAERAEPKAEPPKTEKLEQLRAKPSPSDKNDKGTAKYATYEEYLEDLADWKAEQKIADLEKKMAEEAAKKTVESEQRAISDQWRKQVDAARLKHADFDEIALNPKLNIPQGSAVEQWVLDSDIGTEILYHLASHPEELAAIHAMSPVKAARALTILEAELSDAPTPEPKPSEPPAREAKRVSNAPPPAAELGNRHASPDYDPAIDALAEGDFDKYRKAANAKEMKSRRG